MDGIAGVLLDIDGVLLSSWRPVDGAADAIATLRSAGLPVRFLTNTTSRPARAILDALREGGMPVTADELITAGAATARYLQAHHRGARGFVLDDGSEEALAGAGVEWIDDESAEVVVVGSGGPSMSWERSNIALRALLGGAALVAMHGSRYWHTDDGACLDGGAYADMLAAASGVELVTIGKPSPAMFEVALESLGLDAGHVVMIGDDIRSDVLAARAVGVRGVLVRTGKARPDDEAVAEEHGATVIDSIADLPALILGA